VRILAIKAVAREAGRSSGRCAGFLLLYGLIEVKPVPRAGAAAASQMKIQWRGQRLKPSDRLELVERAASAFVKISRGRVLSEQDQRPAVRARGHFPTEHAAQVPVPCHPQPGPHRNWPHPMDDALKAVINAFAITFGDCWPEAETY
jgi:hypothetical protein